ncbi:MAG: hypothetical protein L3K13_04100 [Thermoplasmata archaeon]|nr:hypothetical protein [Thermoplasmata archaeon]
MTRNPEELELARRRDAALNEGKLDLAFLEAQRLLAALRARQDRPEERRAMAEFATLLRSAGELDRANTIDRYLGEGFERKPSRSARR